MIDKLRKNEVKSTIPIKIISNNSIKIDKITNTNTNFNKNNLSIKPLEYERINYNKSINKKFDLGYDKFKKIKEGNLLTDKRETIKLKKELLCTSSRRISNYIIKRKSEINSSCKSPETTHRDTLKSHDFDKNFTSNLNVNIFCSPRKSSAAEKNNYIEKESNFNTNSNFNSNYTIRYPGGSTSRNMSPKNFRNSYNVNYKSKSCLQSPTRELKSPCRQSLLNSNEFQNFDVDFSSLEETNQLVNQVVSPSETIGNLHEQEFIHEDMESSLLSMNKDLTSGKGGRVEIFKTSINKNFNKVTYEIYGKQKIILIQKLWRGHFLRSQLYDILVRYYKGLAFEKRINNFIKTIQLKYFHIFFKYLPFYEKPSKIINSSFIKNCIKVNTCELEIINKKNTFSHTLISFDAMNEIKLKIINEYNITKTKNLETNNCESFFLEGEKKISDKINLDLKFPNLEKKSLKNDEEKKIIDMIKKLHDEKIIELNNLQQILKSYYKKSEINFNSEESTSKNLEICKKNENSILTNKDILSNIKEEIKKSDKENVSKTKNEGIDIN